MITGKYDVDSTQAEYLAGFYSRKHFERPKFGFFSALKDKLCGCSSAGDSGEANSPRILALQTQENELSELAAIKKDNEVLDKAIYGMLDRQLDMKYVLQLIQDMELMKRIVFQERH